MKRIPLLIIVLITAWVSGGCDTEIARQVVPRPGRVLAIREALRGDEEAATTEPTEPVMQKPTEFVTLRGQFQIQGTPPANPVLSVTKDTAVCNPNNVTIYAPQVVVDPQSKGIKNMVVMVEVPDDWVHPDAKGATDEVKFDQKACEFVDHVFGMQATETLEILNSDPIAHNTKMEPRRNTASNVNVPGGTSTTYKPTAGEKDPFEVTCSIHPWMKAYILIRSNGYYAISGDDGSFEIANVPAGAPIQVRVWHETQPSGVSPTTVNGQPVSWRKGEFTMTLDPTDESKNELAVVVDASTF
ncbi:hypothetical protein [Blastopirellula marina]|uniref:Blue (type 1) copper domain-containing protein n=1 Tax=Blastopirellula marina DSM 3645 TaxID=314230 RepID=A3ZTF8_9BACT|nr:hypothetical protein [Blastopirellula marina]EAQ80219.1 hypothetical protein DSM3645_19523 [Blastopirellula marina DSM 3645]